MYNKNERCVFWTDRGEKTRGGRASLSPPTTIVVIRVYIILLGGHSRVSFGFFLFVFFLISCRRAINKRGVPVGHGLGRASRESRFFFSKFFFLLFRFDYFSIIFSLKKRARASSGRHREKYDTGHRTPRNRAGPSKYSKLPVAGPTQRRSNPGKYTILLFVRVFFFCYEQVHRDCGTTGLFRL